MAWLEPVLKPVRELALPRAAHERCADLAEQLQGRSISGVFLDHDIDMRQSFSRSVGLVQLLGQMKAQFVFLWRRFDGTQEAGDQGIIHIVRAPLLQVVAGRLLLTTLPLKASNGYRINDTRWNYVFALSLALSRP